MSRMLLLGTGGPLGVFATITDSFDRAPSSSSLGNTDTGQAWVAVLGTWGISGNLAYVATPDAGGTDLAYVEASENDVAVQVTFTTVDQGHRLIGRYVDASNYLFVSAEGGGAAYALYKRVAGVNISLGSYAVSIANGDVLKLNMNGNDLTVYLNGTSRITANNAFNNTATKHGIGVTSFTTHRWNDFSIAAAA